MPGSRRWHRVCIPPGLSFAADIAVVAGAGTRTDISLPLGISRAYPFVMQHVWCEIERRALIQSFRAMQAVAEAGFRVLVPSEEQPRWEYASRWIPLPYAVGTGTDAVSIDIDHRAPSVQIGSVSRPLLFPRALLDLYRRSWSDRRVSFIFTGFPTRDRRVALRGWRRRSGVRDASITWSRTGRRWPEKSWDQEYINGLGSARFALCPDGDFIWTYRFFEAVACGAIPVIENTTPLYDGFTHFRMTDSVEDMQWNEADALGNFERVRDLLTVPGPLLREEVLSLVESSRRHSGSGREGRQG